MKHGRMSALTMQVAISAAMAGVALVLLAAELGPDLFDLHGAAADGATAVKFRGMDAPRSLRFRAEEWVGGARTAVAAVCYLLEAEPTDTNHAFAAPHSVSGQRPGRSYAQFLPPSPDQGKLYASVDPPAARRYADLPNAGAAGAALDAGTHSDMWRVRTSGGGLQCLLSALAGFVKALR